MRAWRRRAIELLPELKQLIEDADSQMALWIELRLRFERAFKNNEHDLERRILDYARWSISPHAGNLPNDTSTAVVCAFYEHLGADKGLWPRFHEWFERAEFNDIKDAFRYFLTEAEHSELVKQYFEKRSW